MRFQRLAACAAIAATLVCAVPSLALAKSSGPGVSAASATLVSSDGTELWSRNPADRRAIASTTKLLTALVVLEHASLDETVTVSRKAVAAVDEGGVGLYTGQRLTVRQLMTMMLVRSANDAAEVLAVYVAGSEPKFVSMMNAKAESLGLTDVRAVDPHGLGDRTRCSARSLAVIARELMTYPEVRKIVLKRKVTVPGRGGSQSVFSSTNQLLGNYAGIEGVKTGYTDPAGYCFVGMAKRDGTELVGVVLGAKDSSARFTEMRRLLDWGFAHYRTRVLVSDSEPIGVVAVGRSGEATVAVRADRGFSLMEPVGGEAASIQVSMPATVTSSVYRGQQLGTVEVSQAGSAVATIALLAEAAVQDPDEARAAAARQAAAQAGAQEQGVAPEDGFWAGLLHASTRAMGDLSLRLFGPDAPASR